MTVIQIENQKEKILATNYFQTEYARQGYLYISPNAGCLRILVPLQILPHVTKEATDRYIIGRGVSPRFQRPLYEILFDDRSQNPFSVRISEQQVQQQLKSTEDIWEVILYAPNLQKIREGKGVVISVSAVPMQMSDIRKGQSIFKKKMNK
jgi:hypothetical protein